MLALFLTALLYLAGIAVFVFGIITMETKGDTDPLGIALFVCGLVYMCIGWIPFLGLKILKPQEALVLTLFGKYVGTIKGDGFYFVNPFCSAINPAAKTKLNQSGDVSTPLSAGWS